MDNADRNNCVSFTPIRRIHTPVDISFFHCLLPAEVRPRLLPVILNSTLKTVCHPSDWSTHRFFICLTLLFSWYTVDWSKAENYEWAKNAGCDFLYKSCYEYMQNRAEQWVHFFTVWPVRAIFEFVHWLQSELYIRTSAGQEFTITSDTKSSFKIVWTIRPLDSWKHPTFGFTNLFYTCVTSYLFANRDQSACNQVAFLSYMSAGFWSTIASLWENFGRFRKIYLMVMSVKKNIYYAILCDYQLRWDLVAFSHTAYTAGWMSVTSSCYLSRRSIRPNMVSDTHVKYFRGQWDKASDFNPLSISHTAYPRTNMDDCNRPQNG